MLIGVKRFNVYFATALVAVVVSFCGCRTGSDPEKKPLAMISLHLESNSQTSDTSTSAPVPIFRENPIMVNADKDPILKETDITQAKIVNVLGGFVIQLTFDDRAKWMLEQYTATNPGRRIAILCHWDTKFKETRWIAAPTIAHRISDGVLTFTPDATREESEKIVLGLNNMAKETAKHSNNW